MARSSSRIWSVCARWPFVRSSHALSARPSTPKLSDGWRIQSIAEAIVRYWWMRRNVTGCESSAGPHGRPGGTGSCPSAIRAAVSWSRARTWSSSSPEARAVRTAISSELGWRPYG